ncbi:MAG: transcriptional regulator, partial [Actinomycetota bacterium]|nr:transcriptional regulator [Actinomycetota bacterium]
MRNLILPPASGGEATALAQRRALAAHEQLDAQAFPDAPEIPGLRRLIRESWQRSVKLQANPD